MELPSNQSQLETLTEQIWDLRDQLYAVEMLRANLMNKMKEKQDDR